MAHRPRLTQSGHAEGGWTRPPNRIIPSAFGCGSNDFPDLGVVWSMPEIVLGRLIDRRFGFRQRPRTGHERRARRRLVS
jgi:hypothetical protein